MKEEEIERLRELWEILTNNLDYHARKWYAPNENGDWVQLRPGLHHEILFDLGIGDPVQFEKVRDPDGSVRSVLIPDPERDEIIKQFIYRASNCRCSACSITV
jgi:hypothetical protein